jgi:energy-coupling factor transporter transmembrane protein EcfT
MKKYYTFINIIALFIFNSTAFFIKSPAILSLLLIIFFLILIPLKNPPWKRLKAIIPVAITIVIFQLIFNASLPLEQRFIFGLTAAIRIILISLSVLLFLSITSLYELTRLFGFLPKRWLLLFIMTCYFIPAVLNESEKIKMIQKSRGIKMHSLNFFSNLAALIIPLLHRVFRRAETLSLAMVSRGYEDVI